MTISTSYPFSVLRWTLKFWKKLRLEFSAPFQNRMFLIVIDTHFKWIEAHTVSSITSSTTLTLLSNFHTTWTTRNYCV